jgi:hypothetical protein
MASVIMASVIVASVIVAPVIVAPVIVAGVGPNESMGLAGHVRVTAQEIEAHVHQAASEGAGRKRHQPVQRGLAPVLPNGPETAQPGDHE